MVSIDSRVQWNSFSLEEWLEQHYALKNTFENQLVDNFFDEVDALSLEHKHTLIETLNTLTTITTDSDILTCAYLSFVIDKRIEAPGKLYPHVAPAVFEMLAQYFYLERILETVAVASGEYKEHIRKMLLVTVDDPRLVVIMLSKVLAILRHPIDFDKDYIYSLSKMALEIFAPIAHRLGIGQIKWEMEDHAFHVLYPGSYYELAKQLAQSRVEREAFVESVKSEVLTMLESQQIQCAVTGRSKHLYSIWKKMTKKNKSFSEIYDLNAIRIIVDSVQDCYRALGMIHTQWRYLPEEFDDYIANPKMNGYQSIHTAVFGPSHKIIEVQIRTLDMHKSAELGIAAHWIYKDGTQQQYGYQRKLETLRNFLQRSDISNDVFESAKEEVFGDRTYVFTPKGDVYDLPKGATALDLAYHIHSELGHHCTGAKVQGKMISLTEPLSTGLVVEINTSARGHPSRDWLNPHYGYIKTARARQKISHWFRSLDRGRLVIEGKNYLDKQLKRLGLQGNFSLDDLVQKLNMKNKDDLYHALALGDLKLGRVLEFFEGQQKPQETPVSVSSSKESNITKSYRGEITIGNLPNEGLKYDFAACCHPSFPQPIVALITRGRGMIIHRRECLNLKGLNQVYDRLIFAQWTALLNDQQLIPVILKVTAVDQPSVINNLTSVLLEFNLSVNHLKSERCQDQQLATIVLMFDIPSLAELHRLIDRIHQVNCVIEVERITTVAA